MNTYALTLDVWNSVHSEWGEHRVTLVRKGYDIADAMRRLRTVFISKDGVTVNDTGGLGDGARWFPEWQMVEHVLTDGTDDD